MASNISSMSSPSAIPRNLAIHCILIADTSEVLGRVFPMRATSNDYVSIFLEEVAEKMSHLIPDRIKPSQLLPWRPHQYLPGKPDELPDHVKLLCLETEANRRATKMYDTSLLGQHFPDSLPPDHVHMVIQLPHVQVQPPGQFGLGKWGDARYVGVAPFRAFIATSPYATTSPSDVARPSAFRRFQKDSVTRLLNDRPKKDTQVTPIALLYRPFGQFLDHVRNPPETSNVNEGIEYSVDQFASLMCELYDDEAQRRDKIVPALNAIFSSRGNSNPLREQVAPSTDSNYPLLCQLRPSGTGQLTGTHSAPGQTPDIIIEIKNELGAGGTDPEIQITSYYLQMLARHSEIGLCNFLHGCSLLPALAISIVGPFIGFGALVNLNRPRFVALTPLLPTRSPSGDNSARPALLQAFCAACTLRSRIREDTRQILIHRPPALRGSKNLPYVREVAAWPSTANRNIEFKIQSMAFQDLRGLKYWNAERFLYFADIPNDPDGQVVVKFTRRYFPELHSFCADRGHAPKLLGYGTVPGGWKVVVMENIKTEDDEKKTAENVSRHWARWGRDLTNLMKEFHDNGWVHGDLRETNFVIPAKNPENIVLIDFDWGGESGKASYPTWMLNEFLRDGMMSDDLAITEENDVRVLKGALGRLQQLGIQPMDVSP